MKQLWDLSCVWMLVSHSRRQHRFNEVFLKLLVDQLKMPKCFFSVQITVVNGDSQVIDLEFKQAQKEHITLFLQQAESERHRKTFLPHLLT